MACFVLVCVFLLGFTITFWETYFYFQFVSKNKETHWKATCLIQDHPGKSGGALSVSALLPNPSRFSILGESQWQSHPPQAPWRNRDSPAGWGMWVFSRDSSPDNRVRDGFKYPPSTPDTSHLTYIIYPGTLAVASVWTLRCFQCHRHPILPQHALHSLQVPLPPWTPALGPLQVGSLLIPTDSLQTGLSTKLQIDLGSMPGFAH